MRRWMTVGTSLVALMAFASAPLAAQGILIGPMAGVSFSNITFDAPSLDVDTEGTTGLAIGAFAEFELGGTISIEPQAMYVGRGGDAVQDGESLGLDVHYIEIPVLLKFEFGRGKGGVVPSIFAGPQFGIRVSCSSTIEFEGDEIEGDCADDAVKSTDYGVLAGAGLEFGNFSLQGRYVWGLQNLSDVSELEDLEINNRGFLFTLGYGFKLF